MKKKQKCRNQKVNIKGFSWNKALKRNTSACLVSNLPARMAFVKGLPYMLQVRRYVGNPMVVKVEEDEGGEGDVSRLP